MYKKERVNIVSMFLSLETDVRESMKVWKRMQTSVDNTVNDLRYEIMFENIFIKWNIPFVF